MANNFYDNTIHLDDMKNWTQFELNHRTPVIIRCDDYNNGVITRCDIATPVACLPIYLLGHLRCLDNRFNRAFQTVAAVNDAFSFRQEGREEEEKKKEVKEEPATLLRSQSQQLILDSFRNPREKRPSPPSAAWEGEREGGVGNRAELLLAFKAPPNFIETHQSPSN